MCCLVMTSMVAHHHPPFVCQVRVDAAVRIYGFDKKSNLTHAVVFVDYGVLSTKER